MTHGDRPSVSAVTHCDDGTLRLNFRHVKMDGFSPERYAIGVSNELLWALEGLVE